jgi:DNA-binding transcriptional LysR family regulator
MAVAEEKHFRKAAEKLYISQPGLSRQIKQMEEELGISLFLREGKKVSLTPAGEYLYKEISLHFRHLDSIIDHTRLIHEGKDGHLKIAYIGSAIQKVIPDLLVEFQKQHPRVGISLKEMDNNMQIEALLKGEIDLGFVRMERVPKDLHINPVEEDTFSLVLPEDHPINQNNFKSLSQLKDEAFILFNASYSESYYEKVMQIFDDCGFAPQVSHNTINASSIFRLVENKLGISIVPTSLQEGYSMKVKFIELKDIPQRTTLRMVWKHTNTNPVLEKLIHLRDK